MAVSCESYKQACIIAINGDLVGDNAALLRKAVEEQIEQKQVVEFVLDMEKCLSADSEGLETLLWLRRRCEELFGQLKLANLDETCRKILEITRLAQRFECHDDLLSAVKTVR
jgi:anti-anti-sigma factor